jgi:hypothetical protein
MSTSDVAIATPVRPKPASTAEAASRHHASFAQALLLATIVGVQAAWTVFLAYLLWRSAT